MGMMQQSVKGKEEVKAIIKSIETDLSGGKGSADGSGATKNVAGDLYSGKKKK